MDFGKNVKQARQAQGLSLQELSERCGVSRSMLSQIEREEKNPTIQVACQIAEGLGLSVSQLLGERREERVREVIVTRREQRMVFRDQLSGFERHLLSPALPSRGIEFILNVIPPHGDSNTFPPHKPGVREHIIVAQGRLQVTLGEQTFVLEAGDSIYFEADVPHRFVNLHEQKCQYYLVIDSHQARDE